MWRQVWRQIPHNSLKIYWNNAWMPRNDHSELRICTMIYFHPRNTMLCHYVNTLTNFQGLWRQIWHQIPQFCPKIHLDNVWMSTNDHIWLKFTTVIYCKVRNRMVLQEFWYFWLFKGLRRHCDVKYNIRYHKMVHEIIQIILACQQIILFNYELAWLHIFTRRK